MNTRRFSWYMLAASFILSVGMAHAEVIYTFPSDYPSQLGLFSPTDTQLGRLSRNGIPQDWTGGELYPGEINLTTTYGYETFAVDVMGYPYIQITVDSVATTLFASAYENSYSPINKQLNWLGDAGSSGNYFGVDPIYFQVYVQPGSNLQVVINETTVNGGTGQSFGLMVEGFFDTQYNDKSTVPEPSTIFLVCAGIVFLPLLRLRRSRG